MKIKEEIESIYAGAVAAEDVPGLKKKLETHLALLIRCQNTALQSDLEAYEYEIQNVSNALECLNEL
jgi:hypothetical protein